MGAQIDSKDRALLKPFAEELLWFRPSMTLCRWSRPWFKVTSKTLFR